MMSGLTINRRGAVIALVVSGLALANGAVIADDEPAEGPSPERAEAQPAEESPPPRPRPLPAGPERPLDAHLPDGYFIGRWSVDDTDNSAKGTLMVHIIYGAIVAAEWSLKGEGERMMALTPRGASDEVELSLSGRAGRDFVRLTGHFWHPLGASGAIDGVVDGTKVEGHWTLRRL